MLKGIAAPVATIFALHILQSIFGRDVAMAVAVTGLIGLTLFFWHEGGKKDAQP